MNAKFGALFCCLLFGIAGCSSSSTSGFGSNSGSPSAAGGKIVGKWVPEGEGKVPDVSFIEFTTDGKVVINLSLKGKVHSKEVGTYKLEGDKLTFMGKKPDGTADNETNTVKSLTDDDMVFVDPKGKEVKFKRVK